jgi:hypothetical protein
MVIEAEYKEKFKNLSQWMPQIIEDVKKDVKNEHLKKDKNFFKKHFSGKQLKHLTTEELSKVYSEEIESGEENLGEFIVTRWLLKKTDIYDYFEERLRAVNPKFDEIKELDLAFSRDLVEESSRRFGSVGTYIFSVMNSVVFPEEIYKELEAKAGNSSQEEAKEAKKDQEEKDILSQKKQHEREIARLVDKYEKKLSGIQKKYIHDTENLKKRISKLQKQKQDLEAQKV